MKPIQQQNKHTANLNVVHSQSCPVHRQWILLSVNTSSFAAAKQRDDYKTKISGADLPRTLSEPLTDKKKSKLFC